MSLLSSPQPSNALLSDTYLVRGMRHVPDAGCTCRYRKRGVNDAGRVANEVEIEQVVDAGFDWRTGFPLLASLVQASPSSTASCPGQAR